jgi:hypothetical protein
MYTITSVSLLRNYSGYCKITYFHREFILHFCHIVSLQQSKIHVFGRIVIENVLNIFLYSWILFLRS